MPVTKIAGTGVSTPPGSWVWNNPGNITADDGAYAFGGTSLFNNILGQYLEGTNFGFGLPSDATILGFIVGIEGYWDKGGGIGGAVASWHTKLIGLPTSDEKAISLPLDSPSYVYGGSSIDLWNNSSLTGADINSSSFGVRFWAGISGDGFHTITIRVDTINVEVFFSTDYVQSLSDSASLTESFSKVYSAKRQISVDVSLSEDYTKQSEIKKAPTISFIESLIDTSVVLRKPTDSFSFDESLIRVSEAQKALTGSFNISESEKIDSILNIIDSLSLSELLILLKSSQISEEEILTLSEVMQVKFPEIWEYFIRIK